MAVTLVATVGGATSNSYLTLAAAEALAEYQLEMGGWGTATNANKEKALIAATGYLDELAWIGSKTATTQALLWPRSDATCGDHSYDDDVIPGPVQRGTLLLADALLVDPTALNVSNAAIGELIPGIPNASLKSATVDVVSLEFREGGAVANRNALDVVPGLRNLFGCLCTTPATSGARTLAVYRG